MASTSQETISAKDESVIKYIGSKRVIVPQITSVVCSINGIRRVCDLFAGTTRVGQALKARGYYVISNDLATYSEVLGRTYIQTDANRIEKPLIIEKLSRLQSLPGRTGYFTRTYCEQSRYFQPHNGAKIDEIRNEIENVASNDDERAILLTSLMLAADRVDSTTGLQMAYLKEWAPRSYQPLQMRIPDLLPGPGMATRLDANEFAAQLDDVDLAYIDPPYNQHSFFSNYHIWETLVRNDHPETYGVAKKRVDCKVNKSRYNSKPMIFQAFADLIQQVRARYLLVSFNNEGYLDADQIDGLLSSRGYVASVALDFKRYVGAQIGIYNPRGERVGKVSHLRNREYLFLVGPDRQLVESAMRTVRDAAGLQQASLPLEAAI